MTGETGDPSGFRRAAALRSRLESTFADELALLGSTRFLAAASGGEPAATALLDAAAESEHAARETFAGWAADAADSDARAAFEAVVEQEAEHRSRVAAELDGWTPDGGPPGPMHAYLRGRETTIERAAGGMVGRPLVSLQTHARLVDFFERRETASAPGRAELFSGLRAETEGTLENGLELLATRCETDADWEAAELVAEYTVRLAHDDTADALRSLGVDVESGETG
ncbi:rubrerythrin family protein [Halobellus salinisoli]|uniref:rubrerythrin family protein n=1 Tax=Halobellus salinisoli TaxID=3108500 RepID=UPI00300B9DB4